MIQNLKNAAIAQDQLAWWNEVCQDPEKLKKVLKAYRESAPPPGKRRKTPFSILQYREERRQESSTLLDGVAEMMSELAYISWMAKPKNGCVDALEASARWKDLFNAPGAITDSKGPTEKYKNRVAVHKADLVTQRDANIHSQGYVAAEKEIRKGSQEDIDRMEARLAKETMFKATNSRSRTDQALSMAKASLASGGTGAWSDSGKSAAMIGDVRDLLSESENEGSQASRLRCWDLVKVFKPPHPVAIKHAAMGCNLWFFPENPHLQQPLVAIYGFFPENPHLQQPLVAIYGFSGKPTLATTTASRVQSMVAPENLHLQQPQPAGHTSGPNVSKAPLTSGGVRSWVW